jgi:hypothetical protein
VRTKSKKKAAEIQQQIVEVSAQLKQYQNALGEQLDIIRKRCRHENIGECRQLVKDYFSSRLCLDCGVWEHETGPGFHILLGRGHPNYKRDHLEKVFPFPTVVWEWCYGQGGHELPGHPVVKGQLISTRCYECTVAIWLIEQKRLGLCKACSSRINPIYDYCKLCKPRRRKTRELVLIDAEICPACRGRGTWWYSYGDGTGGGRWADCDTCQKTGVVTTVEAKRYRERSRR